MEDAVESRNVPRNIPDYASTSMSLSAGHRLKALLGHRSYSTLTAKLDSIQTSTTKKDSYNFTLTVPVSWVHQRHSRMTTVNNTKVMTAPRTTSQRCCIPRRGMEYNPIKASATHLSLTRQGGTRNSAIYKRKHCEPHCVLPGFEPQLRF